MSFTKAIWNMTGREEVLVMGGENSIVQSISSVFKMIYENGKVRFEGHASMIQPRDCQATVIRQGEVFSISSDNIDARGTMERLDTFMQTSTQLQTNLPHPLLAPSAVILDNKLFVIGGAYVNALGQAVYSNIMHTFEHHADQADQGTWREHQARLITGRYGAAATVYRGKIYLCGGCNDGGNNLSNLEVFDPAIGTWQNAGEMTKARIILSLFVFEDELYAVGGEDYENTTIEKLSKQTGEWELATDLNEDRWGCVSVLVSSKIFLFGGGHHRSTYDFLDLLTNKWTSKVEGEYKD